MPITPKTGSLFHAETHDGVCTKLYQFVVGSTAISRVLVGRYIKRNSCIFTTDRNSDIGNVVRLSIPRSFMSIRRLRRHRSDASPARLFARGRRDPGKAVE